ncbi:hypothetical protein CYMTET_26928 [Cymbomonas tetramitiformis]|uniref:Uncharacterized protein n=1 Tax=Cymbomonas tetramitiformis TaxID=36881 RepID=A0AAE0FR36_9CHLO|nr:hypothetical protein CYMTET_26928 [Cymbomonas tetramitiformis]
MLWLQALELVAVLAQGRVVRAALAAMLWSQGDVALAEAYWEVACDDSRVDARLLGSENAGCRSFRDPSFLRDTLHWPPSLIKAHIDFLAGLPPPSRPSAETSEDASDPGEGQISRDPRAGSEAAARVIRQLRLRSLSPSWTALLDPPK